MSHRSLLVPFALVLTLAFCPCLADGPAAAPAKDVKHVRVLAIGNSFSNNATSQLPGFVKADPTCKLTLSRASIGGCPLDKHVRLAKIHEEKPDDRAGKPYTRYDRDPKTGKTVKTPVSLKEMLQQDQWDYVTIQQVSTKSPKVETYQPYAKWLTDYIKKYAPTAEIVFHQTWAYRVDGDFDRVFKPGYTQADMYRGLCKAYDAVGKELGIRQIPVGDCFQLARERDGYQPDKSFDPKTAKKPTLPDQTKSLNSGYRWRKNREGKEWLGSDSHHANFRGCFLAGATWYEFFFGKDVRKNTYKPRNIDKDDAAFLRTVAHDVVTNGVKPKIKP